MKVSPVPKMSRMCYESIMSPQWDINLAFCQGSHLPVLVAAVVVREEEAVEHVTAIVGAIITVK
jgi:hypothetical protein